MGRTGALEHDGPLYAQGLSATIPLLNRVDGVLWPCDAASAQAPRRMPAAPTLGRSHGRSERRTQPEPERWPRCDPPSSPSAGTHLFARRELGPSPSADPTPFFQTWTRECRAPYLLGREVAHLTCTVPVKLLLSFTWFTQRHFGSLYATRTIPRRRRAGPLHATRWPATAPSPSGVNSPSRSTRR
jgi:hypothetical protein